MGRKIAVSEFIGQVTCVEPQIVDNLVLVLIILGKIYKLIRISI